MPSIDQIRRLLEGVAEKTNHRNFVVIGSLSVLGSVMSPPPEMTISIDVDTYLKADPGRLIDVNLFGNGTEMANLLGCYVDPVTPQVVSAPSGWESRLVPLPMPSGIVIWFMDIIDAATSKLIRGEQRDMDWVANGLRTGIINAARLATSIEQAQNVLDDELTAALERLSSLTDPDCHSPTHLQ